MDFRASILSAASHASFFADWRGRLRGTFGSLGSPLGESELRWSWPTGGKNDLVVWAARAGGGQKRVNSGERSGIFGLAGGAAAGLLEGE